MQRVVAVALPRSRPLKAPAIGISIASRPPMAFDFDVPCTEYGGVIFRHTSAVLTLRRLLASVGFEGNTNSAPAGTIELSPR